MDQRKLAWKFICYATAQYGVWFGLRMAQTVVVDAMLEWVWGESLFDVVVELRIQRLESQIPGGRKRLNRALAELRREIY